MPKAPRKAPPCSVPSRFLRACLPGQTLASQSPLPLVSAVLSPAMASDLRGTWNLLSSDNVEGYMRALGRREGPCGGLRLGHASGSGRRRPGLPAGPSPCVPSPAPVCPPSLTTGSPGPPLPHPRLSSIPLNVHLTVVGLPPPSVCQSFSPAACPPILRSPASPCSPRVWPSPGPSRPFSPTPPVCLSSPLSAGARSTRPRLLSHRGLPSRWGRPWRRPPRRESWGHDGVPHGCRGRCCDPKPLPGDPRPAAALTRVSGQWAEGIPESRGGPGPQHQRPLEMLRDADSGTPEERPEPGLRPRPRPAPRPETSGGSSAG